MPDSPFLSDDASTAPDAATEAEADANRERSGISDFVRRAVSAGFDAAVRSKEDVVRVATNEIRNWLDGLELDRELRKALANMVLEVKAEIRFRPTEDGKLAADTQADLKARKTPPPSGTK